MKTELLRKVESSELYRQYAETALWSSTDMETDAPLDDNFGLSDLAEETLAQVVEDCDNFFALCHEQGVEMEKSLGDLGHDFWLTRNHHGAGFWDGDWKEGDKLTEWAHTFGSADWYAGDNGLIYQA